MSNRIEAIVIKRRAAKMTDAQLLEHIQFLKDFGAVESEPEKHDFGIWVSVAIERGLIAAPSVDWRPCEIMGEDYNA